MEAEREEVVQGFVSSLPSLPSRVTRAFLSPARLPSVPPSIAAGPSILDSGSLLLEPSTVPERMYYLVPTTCTYLTWYIPSTSMVVPPTADCRD